ncbi:MAG TPA: amidohydrolase family protein [Flavilitoribacter sp.]|nr:amidohydrolase family protein [Flavilitoribacter sp.]HMQ88230.1 amidohydrolase family protein [Flavilitoribacter sp.]
MNNTSCQKSSLLRYLCPFSFLFLLTACAPPKNYDLIFRNGTIVDGSGKPSYIGDVAISGDTIAAVGRLNRAVGAVEVDITGLIIAPGFINIHSHAEADALPTAVNMLSQGVTTEIMNPDGYGPLDLAQQMHTLDSAGLALNVGGFIGFNSVWMETVGMENVRPTEAQILEMLQRIEKGLEAGAWGVSAGLDYVPGNYATTEEVIAVLKPFADWNVVFSNHDRVTPESGFSSIAGMTETIGIGEAAGLIPLITHMKVQGWEQGNVDVILDRMKSAKTSFPGGAAADVYPYLAGMTGLASLIIPTWAQAGGYEVMLGRFKDPALRKQIIGEAEKAMELRFGGYKGVFLLDSQRELGKAMEDYGLESPGETVIRLLEEKDQGIIARFGLESDLIRIMQHPNASIACDCGASLSERGHPRAWGSFPKVLGEYVREKKALTLEDAVYKMSGLPAKTIGLRDRGTLQTGQAADIVVFDPATVIDRATYQSPTLMSEGIVHTVVNGQFAWQDGAATGVKAGKGLFRKKRH